MTVRLRVKASALQPGDYLPATKRTIVGVMVGSRTPSGYVDVLLRNADDSTYMRTWRRNTEIGVER